MSAAGDNVQTEGTVRRRLLPSWLALPVAAGVTVFILNNVLLARLLTSLPGGTVLATTTMAAVGFVAMRVRRAGTVTLVYATYGVLGILGHLGVDAGSYVFHVARVLAAAVVFDAVLALGRFRRWALPLALLPCAGLLLFGTDLRRALAALAFAGGGLALGVLLEQALPGGRTAPAKK